MTKPTDQSPDESLEKDTEEIAKAISQYLLAMGTIHTRGFALFMVDYISGQMTYISDIKQEDAIGVIGEWINKEVH